MAWKMIKKPEEAKPIEKVEIKEPVKVIESKGDRIIVVKELPVRPIREYVDEDGTKVHLFTVEEALTEIMNEE